MKIRIFFISYMAIAVSVNAQQLNLIDKISENYSRAKTYSIDVKCEIEFVEDYEGSNYISTGKVAKDGDNYYSEIMGITSITNNNHQFILEKNEKVMLIQRTVPLNYMEQFNIPFQRKDKPEDKYTFQYENIKKDVVITVIPKNKDSFIRLVVSLDPKKYFLKEVHTYFDTENNQVSATHIYYTNMKFGNKIDKDLFKLDQFLKIKSDKEVVLQNNYKSFKLINYLNRN